jgi:hypothetical protein
MATIPSNLEIGKHGIGRVGFAHHRFIMFAYVSHLASFPEKTIERTTSENEGNR